MSVRWHTLSRGSFASCSCCSNCRTGGLSVSGRHSPPGPSFLVPYGHIGRMLDMGRWHVDNIGSGRRSTAQLIDNT
jgi:hypothetical protein